MKNATIIAVSLALGLPAATSAQWAEWWNWHDRVDPTVAVDIVLDDATGDFLYRYTVSNGPGAEQRLQSLRFDLPVTPTGMAGPPDWASSFSEATEVAGWWASGDIDPDWVPAHEIDVPSVVNDIKPGETLSGFEIRSPCAPSGLQAWYARGYAPLAVRPADDESEWVRVPDWRDDSATGQALAPGDCDIVRDWGNRRPGVDGFVGLVNFASGDALPAGPVAVQLRFSRAGEQVDRSTLAVTLNRVDVTGAFRFNSRGDAVAVFQPGASPLESGRNVLLVSVDGIVPGTNRTATDADRYTFTVPSCSRPIRSPRRRRAGRPS